MNEWRAQCLHPFFSSAFFFFVRSFADVAFASISTALEKINDCNWWTVDGNVVRCMSLHFAWHEWIDHTFNEIYDISFDFKLPLISFLCLIFRLPNAAKSNQPKLRRCERRQQKRMRNTNPLRRCFRNIFFVFLAERIVDFVDEQSHWLITAQSVDVCRMRENQQKKGKIFFRFWLHFFLQFFLNRKLVSSFQLVIALISSGPTSISILFRADETEDHFQLNVWFIFIWCTHDQKTANVPLDFYRFRFLPAAVLTARSSCLRENDWICIRCVFLYRRSDQSERKRNVNEKKTFFSAGKLRLSDFRVFFSVTWDANVFLLFFARFMTY